MSGPGPRAGAAGISEGPGFLDEIQRQRVFGVSLAVLVEGGPRALTLNRVLRRAGMSARTFHAHFESFDECLLALYRTCAGELELALRGAWDAVGAWPEKVRAASAAALDFAARNRPAARFLALDAPALSDALAAAQAASFDRLAAGLTGGREHFPAAAGLNPLTEPVLVAGAITVIAGRLGTGEAEPPAGLEQELCELLLAPYVGAGWGRA